MPESHLQAAGEVAVEFALEGAPCLLHHHAPSTFLALPSSPVFASFNHGSKVRPFDLMPLARKCIPLQQSPLLSSLLSLLLFTFFDLLNTC